MEYLSFSRIKEEDFNDIINMVGSGRFTNNPSVKTKNCDYRFGNILIELKIIEEEPVEKESKQKNLQGYFDPT